MENPRTQPDPAFLEQQHTLRRVAGDSRILDSRIEMWSARMGVDAEMRRNLLRRGYSVRFTVLQGHHIRQHLILPKEVR